MAMPLEGFRVVDWTAYQQGPVASMMLGDLGAEVVKIEPLGTGDPARAYTMVHGIDLSLPGGRTSYIEMNNRNKKSIAVDIKKSAGREIVYRLIERSDVFLHNVRAKAATSAGFDYETLHKLNPRLVYASASGFGAEGPDRDRPGFDQIACARSGFLDAISYLECEEPRVPAAGIADQYGATLLAYGVLAALLARERLGIGQKVESSLLNSMMWLQALTINNYLMLGHTFPRLRHAEATNPLINSYRCRDGKWLCFVLPDYRRFWPDLCRAVGRLDLAADPRFADAERAAEHHQALIVELDAVFAGRDSTEWTAVLRDYPDFIYQTVNTIFDLPGDPQVLANGYITEFPHPSVGKARALNVPVKLSETPGGVRLPAPLCGEHTEEVLLEVCGYSMEQIATFRDAEVI